ncbi:MAG TPA: TRAM domain-containing protein [Rhabdochlamydiaceae bacterium]|nr:TRAM domain-containing protein [Rhabdochlamydiaceae bacterium]
MNVSLAFMRIFFVILCIFFMTAYMASIPSGSIALNMIIGIAIGFVFGLMLIGFDILFRKYNLRSFNIAVIGIFIGYLMGQALVLVFNAILDISSISIAMQPQTVEIIKIALFLFGIYLGTIMTLRASDELYVSIPFIKFAPTAQKKKDLLVDVSVLSDARIIDMAATGLLDHQLVIPRFIIKELYAQSEIGDEISKSKARRSLDVIKKMEGIPNLELRFNDTDFPEVKDSIGKMIRLARLLDANILTADISRIQMASIEGIRIINIHSLSNALKPLMQTGEYIKIKIQRYGKEPRQGVGYLEDGTMVVVNGGGNYIGDTIDAQVLSVKHTTSGRMIFCNASDEETLSDYYDEDEDEHDR